MFKYDMHVHNLEVSPCGHVPAQEVVRLYKEAGYSGICITDHFNDHVYNFLKGTSWKDYIDKFLKGYRIALSEGKNLDLFVSFGLEMKLDGSSNEYLIYGVTEDFLYRNPDLYKLDIFSFSKLIHDSGLLIYQAHPFRPGMFLTDRGLLDGIEGYNGNMRQTSRNDEVLNYAKKNSIPTISGSDFHQLEDLARGGILAENKITSDDMLLSVLRNKEYELIIT